MDVSRFLTYQWVVFGLTGCYSVQSDWAQLQLDSQQAQIEQLEATTTVMQSELEALKAELDKIERGSLPNTEFPEGPTFVLGNPWLHVPSEEFPTLQDALDAVGMMRFARRASATIKLAHGTHEFPTPVWIEHPEGRALRIIGDQDAPGSVVLYFPASNGLVLQGGRVELIDGLTLRGGGPTSGDHHGILVSQGGEAIVGPNVVVESFGGDGVLAEMGGFITADGVTSRSNGGDGFNARHGSIINAANVAENNGETGHFLLRTSERAALWPPAMASADFRRRTTP